MTKFVLVLGLLLAAFAQPHPPPQPVGDGATADKDGAFKSKADACASCKFSGTGSCAMYKTCVCYATNAYFGTSGITEVSDQDNWHWACGNEGGSKYELCFASESKYVDAFGDDVDPN